MRVIILSITVLVTSMFQFEYAFSQNREGFVEKRLAKILVLEDHESDQEEEMGLRQLHQKRRDFLCKRSINCWMKFSNRIMQIQEKILGYQEAIIDFLSDDVNGVYLNQIQILKNHESWASEDLGLDQLHLKRQKCDMSPVCGVGRSFISRIIQKQYDIARIQKAAINDII